jgi:hypothetical protein
MGRPTQSTLGKTPAEKAGAAQVRKVDTAKAIATVTATKLGYSPEDTNKAIADAEKSARDNSTTTPSKGLSSAVEPKYETADEKAARLAKADEDKVTEYKKSLTDESNAAAVHYKDAATKIEGAGSKLSKDLQMGDTEAAGATKKVTKAEQDAAKAGTKAGDEYLATTKELVTQTQGLNKWYKDLTTSYEGIAGRYKKAFDESEAQRATESQTAQRDYGSNAALMSRAAAVGMSGQGPMTGAQQQLMMSTAQQQATSAYSTAQDRIAASDMQRKELGAKVVESSMNQQLANANAGYSMESGMINAQSAAAQNIYGTKMTSASGQLGADRAEYGYAMTGIEGRKDTARTGYGTTMTGIEARTNANVYEHQANMATNTAGLQASMGFQGMREGVAGSAAALTAQQNMPQAQGPSQLSTGIVRGLSGAASGAGVGAAWGVAGGPIGAGGGALIGGALGFMSAMWE